MPNRIVSTPVLSSGLILASVPFSTGIFTTMRLLFPSGTIAAIYSGFGLSSITIGANLSPPSPLLDTPVEDKESSTKNTEVGQVRLKVHKLEAFEDSVRNSDVLLWYFVSTTSNILKSFCLSFLLRPHRI